LAMLLFWAVQSYGASTPAVDLPSMVSSVLMIGAIEPFSDRRNRATS
jgi:hypothetical protein